MILMGFHKNSFSVKDGPFWTIMTYCKIFDPLGSLKNPYSKEMGQIGLADYVSS